MKTCPKCGAEIEDNATFCSNCGENLNNSIQTNAKAAKGNTKQKSFSDKIKKIFSNKKLLAVCAACVAVLLLLIIIISCAASSGNGEYITVKGDTQFYQSGEKLYIINTKGNVKNIDAEKTYNRQTDAYGLNGIFIDDNNDVLYYYNGKKAVKVDEEVNNAVISQDGKNVVFTKDTTKDDAVGDDIYIYSSGKPKKIASGAKLNAVSPDGKTVAYSVYDSDKGTTKGYYYDGKERELGKSKVAFAISNGGKYVYVLKETDSGNTAYVQKGTKDDSKVKLTDLGSYAYFNFDMTEIVYNADGKAYISVKGKEPVKISSSGIDLVLPHNTAVYFDSNSSVYQRRIGVKSFTEKFFTAGSKVIYLTKKYEANTVASGVDYAYLADDGKTVIYLKDDSIRKVNGTKANANHVTLVKEDAYSFLITADGKTIFFMNDDGEIFSQKGTSKAKLITDEKVYTLDIFKGKTLYYVVDGELYATTSGKGKKVGKFNDDVDYIIASDYRVDVELSDGSIYTATNGKSFKLAVKE